MADAVQPRIVARHPHRDRIDVACQHRAMRRLRRGDAEHAGAGAEIEHAAQLAALQHLVEQQQAAAGGAVMAGAERQRRLDLDAELVGRHIGAVVRAMHHEAAGAHRGEAFQAGLDPVPGLDGVERDRRRRAVGGERHQLAHRGLIRRRGEIQRDIPGAVGCARRRRPRSRHPQNSRSADRPPAARGARRRSQNWRGRWWESRSLGAREVVWGRDAGIIPSVVHRLIPDLCTGSSGCFARRRQSDELMQNIDLYGK